MLYTTKIYLKHKFVPIQNIPAGDTIASCKIGTIRFLIHNVKKLLCGNLAWQALPGEEWILLSGPTTVLCVVKSSLIQARLQVRKQVKKYRNIYVSVGWPVQRLCVKINELESKTRAKIEPVSVLYEQASTQAQQCDELRSRNRIQCERTAGLEDQNQALRDSTSELAVSISNLQASQKQLEDDLKKKDRDSKETQRKCDISRAEAESQATDQAHVIRRLEHQIPDNAFCLHLCHKDRNQLFSCSASLSKELDICKDELIRYMRLTNKSDHQVLALTEKLGQDRADEKRGDLENEDFGYKNRNLLDYFFEP